MLQYKHIHQYTKLYMSKYKNINRHNTYPGIEYDLGLVNPETHIANFQNNDV